MVLQSRFDGSREVDFEGDGGDLGWLTERKWNSCSIIEIFMVC